MGKVSYGREAEIPAGGLPPSSVPPGELPPTHRLVVYDLRGAWTKTNRDIAFALFDTYMKNKVMFKEKLILLLLVKLLIISFKIKATQEKFIYRSIKNIPFR